MTKEVQEATLLFLKKGDKVLLAMKKRGYGQGKWNGVGGKVESGESVIQALVRECQEEIGVTPLNSSKIGVVCVRKPKLGEAMRIHVFICNEWNGKPSESEEMKPKWFVASRVPYDKMWQSDFFWLPCALVGESFAAEFVTSLNDEILENCVIFLGKYGFTI